jgi:hypothetical protein
MSHYGVQHLVADRQRTLQREAAENRLAKAAQLSQEKPRRPRAGVLGRVLTPVVSFFTAGLARGRTAPTAR